MLLEAFPWEELFGILLKATESDAPGLGLLRARSRSTATRHTIARSDHALSPVIDRLEVSGFIKADVPILP